MNLCKQYDQMVILCFNIWPIATMKISPEVQQICQSKFAILTNMKLKAKNLSNTCKLLPKWQNFAKSDHTVCKSEQKSQLTRRRHVLMSFMFALLIEFVHQFWLIWDGKRDGVKGVAWEAWHSLAWRVYRWWGGEIAESSNVYFDFIDNDVLGTCVSRKMKSKI